MVLSPWPTLIGNLIAEVLAKVPKARSFHFKSCEPVVTVAEKIGKKNEKREQYVFETICDALKRNEDLQLPPMQWSKVLKENIVAVDPLKPIPKPTTSSISSYRKHIFVSCRSYPLLNQARTYSTHNEQSGYRGQKLLPKEVVNRLQQQANRRPTNAATQYEFLVAIIYEDPHHVIKRMESGSFVADKKCVDLYNIAKELIKEEVSQGQRAESVGPTLTVSPDKIKNWITKLVGGAFHKVFIIFIEIVVLVIALYIIIKYLDSAGLRPNKDFTATIPDETFDDVAGIDSALEEIKQLITFLRDTKKFEEMGCKIPKGYLLTGPPGVGKTLLAKALAGEANVPFFFATGSEFDEMFVGLGASRMRNLFKAAKDNAPSIIFIDEIDSFGGKRQKMGAYVHKDTLNQLLSEMDGFKENLGIIVIAATNMPEELDPALTRAGRFDSKITIRPPNQDGRLDILRVHTSNTNLAAGVELEDIAKATPGMTGADLAAIVNAASLRAVILEKSAIEQDDLEFGRAKIIMGSIDTSIKPNKFEKRIIAHHEAGHAAITLLQDKDFPDNIYIATILARGNSLGHVFNVPNEDHYTQSIDELISRIDILLGGRAAEELLGAAGNVTTGCSSDFECATHIAEHLIGSNGYSKKLGFVRYDKSEFQSTEMNKIVNDEVKALLDERYEHVKAQLKKYERNWRRLSSMLLEYETLTGEECRLVWEGYKPNRSPTDGIPSSIPK